MAFDSWLACSIWLLNVSAWVIIEIAIQLQGSTGTYCIIVYDNKIKYTCPKLYHYLLYLH